MSIPPPPRRGDADLSHFRLPREGGDPDRFTRPVIDTLDPRLRGEGGGGGSGACPFFDRLSKGSSDISPLRLPPEYGLTLVHQDQADLIAAVGQGAAHGDQRQVIIAYGGLQGLIDPADGLGQGMVRRKAL